jgi:hypothetical protein
MAVCITALGTRPSKRFLISGVYPEQSPKQTAQWCMHHLPQHPIVAIPLLCCPQTNTHCSKNNQYPFSYPQFRFCVCRGWSLFMSCFEIEAFLHLAIIINSTKIHCDEPIPSQNKITINPRDTKRYECTLWYMNTTTLQGFLVI